MIIWLRSPSALTWAVVVALGVVPGLVAIVLGIALTAR